MFDYYFDMIINFIAIYKLDKTFTLGIIYIWVIYFNLMQYLRNL